ncbi:hypothetical protein ACFSTA_13130 [Ornithinibacillus salinisoli]|uniref:Uncharacterized protein n=1 Tax=Ornithinibacillus salinisoli TaxID=1848459 RepID=A0ABW4W4V1_9BACI
MSKITNDKQDQAEQLRAILSEMQEQANASNKEKEYHSPNRNTEEEKQDEIDILNLPPRKEIHKNKKSGIQWKVSRPLIRFLFVSLIIAGIVVWVIWSEEIISFFHL